jgi:hypothetical protein
MLAACCVRCEGCSLCLSAFRLPFFHALLRGSFFPTNPRTQPPTVQHKNRGSQNQIKIFVINLGKAICHIDTGTSILPFSLVDLYRFTLLWNNSHSFEIQFYYHFKSADTSHANFNRFHGDPAHNNCLYWVSTRCRCGSLLTVLQGIVTHVLSIETTSEPFATMAK